MVRFSALTQWSIINENVRFGEIKFGNPMTCKHLHVCTMVIIPEKNVT